MDMKEIITEAARKLVLEKKVKKLSVKDIVEECQITRQAFYYHFEGIPDMIQWSIKRGTRRLLDLAPDGRRLLFCCFFPSAGGRGLSFVRRSHVTKTPHEIRDRISVNRPAPQQ